MEENYIDFEAYSLEDFVNNQDFVLWALTPSEASDRYWSLIVQAFPKKENLVKEAKIVVQSLRFETSAMSLDESELLWASINTEIGAKKPGRSVPLWLKAIAAAAILLLVANLALTFYSQFNKIEVTTKFGQLRTLSLPDGTLITLNANSRVSFFKTWDKDKIREVWVNGEAFLKVNHLHKSGNVRPGERFIVHINQIDVEVLGTSFNVNDRRGHVQVALLSGKIGLKSPMSDRQLLMKPGEITDYDQKKISTKRRINVTEYSSWKKGVLHFNNTPIIEVFNYIEDTYGYKAIIENDQIKGKRVSGSFSVGSEDKLLKSISASLGISIRKVPSTKQLIIK
jgi:transmembrane sensor